MCLPLTKEGKPLFPKIDDFLCLGNPIEIGKMCYFGFRFIRIEYMF